jgi:hypothetical protein
MGQCRGTSHARGLSVWVPKPQEVKMGTQVTNAVFYTWRKQESHDRIHKCLVIYTISISANWNGILGSELSGLGAQPAAESPDRCMWCISQPSHDMHLTHHMTSHMIHHMTCIWCIMWLITWPLDLEKKAESELHENTENKLFHKLSRFLDISLLLAPKHMQTLQLSYIHNLQTSFSFFHLDPPLHYFANLTLPMCSSPLFYAYALEYGLWPLKLACTL